MSVDAALASGALLPGASLSLFQQLEVIDEFLAAEVTFYTGSSLAHSLYTCGYLHRLELVWDGCPLLRAYLLFALKSLEMLRRLVVSADIHTEEDWYYNSHAITIGAWSIQQNFRDGFSTATPAPQALAAATTAFAPASEKDAGAAAAANNNKMPSNDKGLFGGLKVAEIIAEFDAALASIDDSIARLRAAAVPAAASDEDLFHPASEDSSELQLLTLLRSRFVFRKAWYQLHLLLRRPPYMLRANLADCAPIEATIATALRQIMRSSRGSTEREEEALRQKSEQAYNAEVAAILARYAEAQAAAAASGGAVAPPAFPAFPKKPSSNLSARALSFGFDARLTSALVQTSPPKQSNMMHRRDAVAYLQNMMEHFAFMHLLPPLAGGSASPSSPSSPSDPSASASASSSSGGGLSEIIVWFERWHECRPNIILRSHMWLYVQYSYRSGRGGGGGGGGSQAGATEGDKESPMWEEEDENPNAAQEPSADLFGFLQDSPVASAATCPPDNQVGAQVLREALQPFQGHYNTHELLIRSHLELCGSIEKMALQALVDEGAQRRSSHPAPVLDPTTAPMTYDFFISRCRAPLYSYVKILLEHHASYRRKILDIQGTFHLDWNILMADARSVDVHMFGPKYLEQEFLAVVIPPGMHPQARATHPNLYFQHNCYAMVMDRLTHFEISYILSGLECGLYSAKEAQITLWYLEHLISSRINNKMQCYRNRQDLLALKKPLSDNHAHGPGRKKPSAAALAAQGPRKYALPSVTPPQLQQIPSDDLFEFAMLEAQQLLCRGVIQLMEGVRRMQIAVKRPVATAATAAATPAGTDSSSNGNGVAVTEETVLIDAVRVPAIDATMVRITRTFGGVARSRFTFPL